VIFPAFDKGECHGKLPNRKLHDVAGMPGQGI